MVRYKYEHKLATGKTLDELSASMTEIVNIRNVEADEAMAKGYEVYLHVNEYFKPVGSLTKENGVWMQVMRRII